MAMVGSRPGCAGSTVVGGGLGVTIVFLGAIILGVLSVEDDAVTGTGSVDESPVEAPAPSFAPTTPRPLPTAVDRMPGSAFARTLTELRDVPSLDGNVTTLVRAGEPLQLVCATYSGTDDDVWYGTVDGFVRAAEVVRLGSGTVVEDWEGEQGGLIGVASPVCS
jgi:hypothetical protein